MTVIWLIVWLLAHTPDVAMFGSWNNWGIALAGCGAIDLLGALRTNSRADTRRDAMR
jgi:hypothetical protein